MSTEREMDGDEATVTHVEGGGINRPLVIQTCAPRAWWIGGAHKDVLPPKKRVGHFHHFHGFQVHVGSRQRE